MIMKSVTRKIQISRFIPWVTICVLILGVAVATAQGAIKEYSDIELPLDSIELTISKTKYNLNEDIYFTIGNYSATPIVITNQCPRPPVNVYVWETEKWNQVSVAEGNINCDVVQSEVSIESYDSYTSDFNQWSDLFSKPGVYRIALMVDHYSGAPFQDFVIMEEPEEVIVEDVVFISSQVEPAQVLSSEISTSQRFSSDELELVNEIVQIAGSLLDDDFWEDD